MMNYDGASTAFYLLAKHQSEEQEKLENEKIAQKLALELPYKNSKKEFYDSQTQLNKVKTEKEQLEKELLQLQIDNEKLKRR
ncbi:hypothetical protein LL033_26125 (plasmid) [Clostridium estertheticum]|uniref:hypothetical protein n=1 Tax=Clostridium estertheticum TaxID=238834 RepID=UPI001C0DA798|nr:hypothetical protein [Clostridium estertheticum]MBU3218270.1 hypothetical protein [Clostridium estertheticum]WAG58230.1 hypothetical protein LL033_26125 [Clostridium estertheticum]